jgi:hypothetical protein
MKKRIKKRYKEALCPKDKFCDWKVLLSDNVAQVEVCRNCARKIIFNKINGNVDNDRYLRTHIRAFCQPFGPTADVYEAMYGKQAVRQFIEDAREQRARAERMKGYDYDFKKAMEGEKKKWLSF